MNAPLPAPWSDEIHKGLVRGLFASNSNRRKCANSGSARHRSGRGTFGLDHIAGVKGARLLSIYLAIYERMPPPVTHFLADARRVIRTSLLSPGSGYPIISGVEQLHKTNQKTS